MAKKYDYKSKTDLEELFKQGLTQKEIAEKCKCSALTAGNYLRKYNLTKGKGRPKGSKNLAKSSSLNRDVRRAIKAKDTSNAADRIRKLLKMIEDLPEGSDNIKSAIKGDMADLIRSL